MAGKKSDKFKIPKIPKIPKKVVLHSPGAKAAKPASKAPLSNQQLMDLIQGMELTQTYGHVATALGKGKTVMQGFSTAVQQDKFKAELAFEEKLVQKAKEVELAKKLYNWPSYKSDYPLDQFSDEAALLKKVDFAELEAKMMAAMLQEPTAVKKLKGKYFGSFYTKKAEDEGWKYVMFDSEAGLLSTEAVQPPLAPAPNYIVPNPVPVSNLLDVPLTSEQNLLQSKQPGAQPLPPATKGNMNDLSIFRFGPKTDGNAAMKDVLGGKGANLAEMSKLGVPVPPGFTIPCEASVLYNHPSYTEQGPFLNKVESLLAEGDAYLTKHFGYAPLVSVRSGARVSMPGMMDTILNVGLTDANLPEWEKRIGVRAARDSYRRLIQMYGAVAMGIDMKKFDHEIAKCLQAAGKQDISELDDGMLLALCEGFKLSCEHNSGNPFPQTREHQLLGATIAVFKSWNNQRAKDYRKEFNIPEEWGTAVTIQSMVFGNLNDQSATGVYFTRNSRTGQNVPDGEYLVNAQGEEVVVHGGKPMKDFADWNKGIAEQLTLIGNELEAHYKDMQDIEFTVQDGELYILQTRNGKREARAAFRIARDMANEGLITKQEAAQRVTAKQFLALLKPTIDPDFKVKPHLTGIAAGGGVVKGVAVFSAADAINCTEPCILVTHETTPDDFAGMAKSVGILTASGGLTSHAAVVARGMDKACVVGATDMTVYGNMAQAGAWKIHEKAKLTIDGASGNVWIGLDVPVIEAGVPKAAKEVVSWMSPLQCERLLYSKDTLAQQVADADAPDLHIDLCLLAGLSTGDLLAVADSLVAALKHCKSQRVVLDFSPMSTHYSDPDRALDRMLGLNGAEEAAQHSMLVSGLLQAVQWSEEARAKTLIKLPPESVFTQTLKNKGFKVMGPVQTVADLLSATGPISISPEVVQKVFGGAETLALLRKTFNLKEESALPAPQYWFTPILYPTKEA